MRRWLHKIEVAVDRSIPYALVLLLFLITAEIFFHDQAEPFSLYISIIDWIIIGIFVVDLGFKYYRSKNVSKFVKEYWLEIIAVFPAFLVVRVIEEFIIIANLDDYILLSQEALEVESRANRISYFRRFLGPLARLPRFLKAFSFYEKPRWL